MRAYFSKQTQAKGYEVIDMQPVFIKHHKLTGEQFEFYPIDAHWNEVGHRMVADEIRKSKVFYRVFN
jgi:hypothetical protein